LATWASKARRLVFRIVQLGEAVGDFAAGDEQLEAFGDVRGGLSLHAPAAEVSAG
jgi:hypothetical protein